MRLYVTYSAISEILAGERFNEYIGCLPVFERQKISQYRDWQDRLLSLFGKLLLKRGLRDMGYSTISLDTMKLDPNYRPYLPESDIDFNISHSGSYVICVIGIGCRVGVDLELKRDIPLEDFTNQFRNDEWRDILQNDDQNNKFYEYWTKKEAIIKFDGKGLQIPLKQIFIAGNEASLLGHKYYLIPLLLNEEYSCHIALDRQAELPCECIREIQWK